MAKRRYKLNRKCFNCGKNISNSGKSGLCFNCCKKGKIPWNKGKVGACSIESRIKMRLSHLNKKISIESINKQIETKARLAKERGYYRKTESIEKGKKTRKINAEINGFFNSPEARKKMSETRKGGVPWNKGLKGVCIPWNKGIPQTNETKRKLRLKRIDSLAANNYNWPNYNKEFCIFCAILDKKLSTFGDYAANGRNGEKLLKSLGYWPDYFNKELKLIIEYDEGHHFNLDGTLKDRDVVRQQEIKNEFPDFLFIRINSETNKLTIV